MSRFVRPAAGLVAASLVAIAGALLYGPSPKPAGASRLLVDAYCTDDDGGPETTTVDVRVLPGAPASDGGWSVAGDAGPIWVRSLDEWADRIEQRTGCTLIRATVRQDTADANAWPAQAVEVRKRAAQFGCRCSDGLGGWILVPCVVHAGRHDIAREFGCAPGANAEPVP